MNNIVFIIISIVALILVINSVRRKIFSIKESFWGFCAAIVMLLLSIFPYSIDGVAQQLNISYPPSLFFVLCIVFLVFIIFRNCKQIAQMQTQIIDLTQELSLLKSIKDEEKTIN